MKLKNIKDTEQRARYIAKIRKKIWGRFARNKKTTPLFVAGWQRSGTTMMMNIFHQHPDIEVFDEAYNSEVFFDYRVRSFEILEKTLQGSCFGSACYKIICDSHILNSFIEYFPEAKIIWMYRNVADNAESHLCKFSHATRAIRLVALEKPGGGWFAEGVTPSIAKEVRKIASSGDLTEFDFACLAWWVRNILFFELGLERIPNVRLLQYEALVKDPKEVMNKLFYWVGSPRKDKALRFVHARSVDKEKLPDVNRKVEMLCNELREKLSREYIKNWH